MTPNYDKLSQIREHFEGFSPNAYKDSGGVWTIGYGSTYNYEAKRKVMQGDKIDRMKVIEWMKLEDAQIATYLNQYIKVSLNESQTTAIFDYVYNRGIGNFLKTKLDELINADPNDQRIKAEIIGTGLWDRLGNKLWGLGRRRRCEAHLYFTGEIKFNWPKWS
jgi:lysozyme